MDELLSGLKSQLEEQSSTLRELKQENEALKESMNQMQLDVSKIKETIPFDNPSTEINFLSSSSERETEIYSITKEPAGEYAPKKIRSMTLDEERDWVKARIEELKLQHKSKIQGSTISFEESILKIFSNLRLRGPPTCAIKLANYSKSTLFSPLYYVPPNCGRKRRLPPLIDSDGIEAICFQGIGGSCKLLLTFEIGTTILRLTIVCWMNSDETCRLGIGFSPTNVPLSQSLYWTLIRKSIMQDDWVLSSLSKSPVEIFSNQGSFFVRGHMTPDPNSIVNIEFFESSVQSHIAPLVSPGRTTSSGVCVTLDYLQRVSSLVGSSDGVNCIMEVVNGLNASLKLRGYRSCECSRNLAQVPPLGSEMFIATGKTCIVAAFAYAIEGTDLVFLVAIKVQGNENKLAALFLNLAHVIFDDALDDLLDQTKWSDLLRQKFAYAKDGERTYQIRNIRASIKMTDRQKSQVQIRLFAV